MTLQWTDPTFLHAAAMLVQFVQVGVGYLGETSGLIGGLAPRRMEFTALQPVLGFAALLISAAVRWWLMDTRTRVV
ncbi:MAG: hypothetical protein HY243_18885 [Proteobacteria bacterium]|nr:hypothetical protein [Pseudomonadota bacterium]